MLIIMDLLAMNIYFTSDTHFGHENIISYCQRPFTNVEEMNRALIANWNATVQKNDTVYHLGDFFMGKKSEWRSIREQLNGKIILIAGNHDPEQARQLFTEVYEELYIELAQTIFWLCHYPYKELDYHGRNKCIRPEPIQTFDYALCGHVHNRWLTNQHCFNVGVDVHHYRPISLAELLILLHGHM